MKKSLVLGAALSCGLLGIAGGAAATPGQGTTSSGMVTGTLEGPVREKADGVMLRTKGDTTVRQFTLTYDVGGFSGCHSHFGLVIATVKEGTVTRETPEGTETFTVDDSFIENGPHSVVNAGAVPAVLAITHIFPKETPPLATRIDNDAEDCTEHSH